MVMFMGMVMVVMLLLLVVTLSNKRTVMIFRIMTINVEA